MNNPRQNLNAEENANYYQESCKLYLANVLLTCQLKELLNEKNELLEKIDRLEKQQKRRPLEDNNSGAQGVGGGNGGSNSNFANDKKRIRRSAKQIERNYKCPVANCEKSYGSENSLIQHVKLKHPEADIKNIINQININIGNEEQSQENSQHLNNQENNSAYQQKKKKQNDPEDDEDDEEDEEDEDDE